MSTRATYQFQDDHGTFTFYIHHDGYPTGAASYFQNMKALEAKPRGEGGMQTYNHGLAEIFFRANDSAELTESHDAHGDTAYRYTVTPKKQTNADYRFGPREYVLTVEGSYDHENDFHGTIEEFLKNYGS